VGVLWWGYITSIHTSSTHACALLLLLLLR
jgi:hypothetical protein